MPPTRKSTSPSSPQLDTRSDGRTKMGCQSCRLRQKKCDTEKYEDDNTGGSCQSCKRLHIECLGWAKTRQDWMKDHDLRKRVKAAITKWNSDRGHRRGVTKNSRPQPTPIGEDDILSITDILNASSPRSKDETIGESSVVSGSQHDENTFSSLSEDELSPVNLDTFFLGDLAHQPPPTPFEQLAAAYGPPLPPQIFDPTEPEASTSWMIPLSQNSVFQPIEEPRYLAPSSPFSYQHNLWVEYYFNNVESMQYIFNSSSRKSMWDLLLKSTQQSGFLADAVCSLSSLHYARSMGLDTRDPTVLYVITAQQMFDKKLANLPLTTSDAAAALQFISFWLFAGGGGDWSAFLQFANDWYEATGVTTGPNPAEAFHALSTEDKFAAKTTMWFDVLSSVTLRKPPRHLAFYRRLFAKRAGVGEEFMITANGCSDDVMLAIANISDLDCWYVEQKKAGTLSVPEFNRKGAAIEAALRSRDFTTVTHHYGEPNAEPVSARVFREAAILYLHTILSGPNPKVAEIRNAVFALMNAVKELPAGKGFERSLVFPLCLGGCMSTNSEQREFFRGMVSRGASPVGNCGQALQLMELVWSKQDSTGGPVCWRDVMKEQGVDLLLV